jgi:hypothetical protein
MFSFFQPGNQRDKALSQEVQDEIVEIAEQALQKAENTADAAAGSTHPEIVEAEQEANATASGFAAIISFFRGS